MRVWAKHCAAVALISSIPLFPAAGAPSSPLKSSSEAPFLATVHAAKAAQTLEAGIAPALRVRAEPTLEAIRPRRLSARIPVPAGSNTEGIATQALPRTSLIVEEGQNSWQIATTYGISVDALLSANGLRPDQVLRIGQRLVIPSSSDVPDRATRSTPAPPRPASRHVVEEGDSLWTIAQNYGVSVEGLASANNLTEESIIHPGEKLTIPAKRLPGQAEASAPKRVAAAPRKAVDPALSISIVVQPGQTLYSIARAHKVSVNAITAANHLSSADRIRVGQRLTIPGNAVTPRLRHATIAAPEPAPPSHSIAGVFLWPARGMITSGFGWRRTYYGTRYHSGIDISANRGTPIRAAMAGRVTHAGWYGGYGLAVVLDHGDGLQTIYGHASKILVHVGDEVDAGETVALVGCTGVCTGPHIHFEVRIDGRPVNPVEYLP